MLSAFLMVGVVVKPQGVIGQVKVRPLTDDPERFYDLEHLYIKQEDAHVRVPIGEVRVHQGFVYLVLNNAATREQAEEQRGTALYVSRDQAVPLDEDSHFIVDLVGCRVVNTQGEAIGVLREVLQPGAADVYVIKTQEGSLMVPALKRVVIRVDVAGRLITLDEKVLGEVAVFDR